MSKALNTHSPLINTLEIEPSESLWQRVPTKDTEGNYLADFMMLIPKLNKQEDHHISTTINKLSNVLSFYQDIVVFADLNMKINVLWISLKPIKGMCVEIPAAIKSVIPEAKLIGDNASIKSPD